MQQIWSRELIEFTNRHYLDQHVSWECEICQWCVPRRRFRQYILLKVLYQKKCTCTKRTHTMIPSDGRRSGGVRPDPPSALPCAVGWDRTPPSLGRFEPAAGWSNPRVRFKMTPVLWIPSVLTSTTGTHNGQLNHLSAVLEIWLELFGRFEALHGIGRRAHRGSITISPHPPQARPWPLWHQALQISS